MLASSLCFVKAETNTNSLPQPVWGTITPATNGTGEITIEVRAWPTDGKLALPTPFPNISAAYLLRGIEREPLKWVFNENATELHLEVPATTPSPMPATILLETAEKSAQFSGGRITLSALDAQVQGAKAKLESHPGNHRIGFWTDTADTVSWDDKPTRWGMYDVELTYSAAGGDGTELQIDVAGKSFTVTRPATGSWYRYATLPVGRFYLEKAQPFSVKVSCKTLKGGAVMNLKAVTLRPAPESPMVKQAAPGAITLFASNAITHSITMRYEPATNKNCLGYWVSAKDWAEWQFKLSQPGAYQVEVWHGAVQGGSEIQVEANGEKLSFLTETTGDYHKHTAARIGPISFNAPGIYSISVKPQNKKGGAIMDIGEVKLIPVEK